MATPSEEGTSTWNATGWGAGAAGTDFDKAREAEKRQIVQLRWPEEAVTAECTCPVALTIAARNRTISRTLKGFVVRCKSRPSHNLKQ